MAIHVGPMSFGLVASFVALGGVMTMIDQGNWLPAQGRVLSVSKTCELEARERGLLTETKYTKELDCDLVDAFKSLHADKSWHVSTLFSGQVLVERPGATNTIAMPLRATKTTVPAVGDILALRQDPADPSKVTLADESSMGPTMLGIAVGIAVLCFWLGTGAPGPWKRRAVARLMQPLEPVHAGATPVVAEASRTRRELAAPRKSFGKR